MIIRIMTTLRMTDRSVRDELLLLRQYRADLGHHPDPGQHDQLFYWKHFAIMWHQLNSHLAVGGLIR